MVDRQSDGARQGILRFRDDWYNHRRHAHLLMLANRLLRFRLGN
jgi:hypothetical protein